MKNYINKIMQAFRGKFDHDAKCHAWDDDDADCFCMFGILEQFLLSSLQKVEKKAREKTINSLRLLIAGNQVIDLEGTPLDVFTVSVNELDKLKEKK